MARIDRTAGLAGLLAVLLAAPTAAAPDLANGERVAKRWCAECHVVAPGQAKASADVPSFASISDRSPEALAGLLAAPDKAHSRMQNLTLSRGEIADLVAYIKAQKP